MSKIRWGILGTGRIAGVFAEGLAGLDDAELVAVGSRSAESAAAFGERYAVPRRHASYAALAHDPGVDVVYVATPHTLHRENTLLCLGSGKPVLCEKPFAINAAEAASMIAAARERGLFLMEAIWTRFLPHIVRLRELLAAGALGELRMLRADFSFRTEVDPRSRLFDPALGGGALLDVGIYPVSLASMLFGRPERIASMADLGTTGVDEQAALIFGYSNGRMAVLTTATRTEAPHEALLLGTEGMIRLHHAWWRPTTMTLSADGRPDEQIDVPASGNGYGYESAEVMRCLRAGLRESDTIPLDETLAIMRTLDEVRAQWGLRYPSELSLD
ncbi:MAG: Gfo/Idh/MocA family oxidoreductase [Kouleothrix sp.]|nr:Gfo/Idh/MocA family oxidoreductase [Kouleothrix sp.]